MTPRRTTQLTNVEIAVYVVYERGGALRPVPTEDVALRAFELAPSSFSWIRYPQYPDKDVTRSALVDARKEKNGHLVVGRAGKGRGQSSKTGSEPKGDGWQLTEAGVRWVMENELRLTSELQQGLQKDHRQEILAKVRQIRRHTLFREFLDKSTDFTPTLGALAELLRCRVDADPPVWTRRFETFRNLAVQTDQQDVLEFLGICEKFVEDTRRCDNG